MVKKLEGRHDAVAYRRRHFRLLRVEFGEAGQGAVEYYNNMTRPHLNARFLTILERHKGLSQAISVPEMAEQLGSAIKGTWNV